MTPLLGPNGESVIGDEQEAVKKLAALPSFTLGECLAIHTSLLVSRAHIEEHREQIIEEHGKATFNAMKNNVHSAVLKLSVMMADAMDEQAADVAAQAIIDATQTQGDSDD